MAGLGEIEVFYFSACDYSFLKQRPQQLFDSWVGMGQKGIKFFYVEPPRSLKRVGVRVSAGYPGVLPGQVCLPIRWMRNPLVRRINSHFVASARFRKNAEAKRVAIVSAGFWWPLIRDADFDFIAYDYLDALEVHAGARDFQALKTWHDELLNDSDIVFVTAKALEEEVLERHPEKEVVNVSNGVDMDFFERSRDIKLDINYKRGKRRVAGYVGAIYEWINLNLVFSVAERIPEIDFVLAGPLGKNLECYADNKPQNVYFLGPRPYQEVPAIISMFDVALIPFNESNISISTDPIKLYEYFSLGKPVVSTPMRQLEKYNDGCRLVMAETEDEFVNAVRYFLENHNALCQEERKRIAEASSWRKKAETMLRQIMHRL